MAIAAALLLCAAAAALQSRGIDSSSLRIGAHLSSGTFGSVHWGELDGAPVVVKRAFPAVPNAAKYLEVEARFNERMRHVAPASAHLAPYLGSCNLDGARVLLWRKAGDRTLEDYLTAADAPDSLALALGLPPGDNAMLMRRLLRELLSVLELVHAQRIVHRDLKPANLLVDASTQTLRLIDFGSACEAEQPPRQEGAAALASLLRIHLGAVLPRDQGPASTLYMAPEQFVVAESPFAFDVYSAAVCWLRCIIPAFRASESDLFDFRIAVRDRGHQLDAWLDAVLAGEECVLESEIEPQIKGEIEGKIEGKIEPQLDFPPGGCLLGAGVTEALELFGCDEQSRLAWRLLRQMMHPAASERIEAAAALDGAYLGGCEGLARESGGGRGGR